MIHINYDGFTPENALSGGLLIGSAVALLILANGRIAGISGIISGLLTPVKGNILWRIAFISGIFISPLMIEDIWNLYAITIQVSWPLLASAGFLVGFGSRLGSGCTSGHGVCGVSRLSGRSVLATALFMTTGFVTTYLFRHFF